MKKHLGWMIGVFVLVAPAAEAQDVRMQTIWAAYYNRVNDQVDKWFTDGEFPKSINTLRISNQLFPGDGEVATNLGWLLQSTEQDAEALSVYVRYKNQNPKDPDAAFPEANYYFLKKAYARIPALLEPYLAKKPHPNSYRILAHSYERIGKLKDSQRVWKMYIALMPSDQPAKNNLRRVEDKMKASQGGITRPK